MSTDKPKTGFERARWSLRGTAIGVGLFSAAVNLLMLTGPLFMLQVYDRVLTSRSLPTLVGLFALVGLLYAFMALFDFVRNRMLSRAAHRLDLDLAPHAQRAHILSGSSQAPLRGRPESDLSQVRQFLGSGAVGAFFDLPWVPIYIAIVFLLHPWLGYLAIAGVVVVVVLTAINFLSVGKTLKTATHYEQKNATLAEEARDNAEAIVSLGMLRRVGERWSETREGGMAHVQKASSVSEWLTAFTKAFRMFMQSGVLALGAWLVIRGEITAGAMIAASILVGRALAPVDQSIAQWRNATRARQAWKRLASFLAVVPAEQDRTALPAPKGHLKVVGLGQLARNKMGQPDGGARPILGGIDFALEPGDGLGVIGRSASGKSSLARLLVGVWSPDRGTVRLDGAALDQWDPEELGKHIGYLPQRVHLISGTVRDNIARFDPEAQDEDVVAAAQLAGVHDIILGLPDGYDTLIGDGGTYLSGGQAQRVALARAVFGKPALVILDEPDSSLDSEGETALTECVRGLRERGATVIVIAHRRSTMSAVNKLLMLDAGQQMGFGDKDEVLAQLEGKTPRAVPGPSPAQTPSSSQNNKPATQPGTKKPTKADFSTGYGFSMRSEPKLRSGQATNKPASQNPAKDAKDTSKKPENDLPPAAE